MLHPAQFVWLESKFHFEDTMGEVVGFIRGGGGQGKR